MAELTNKEKLTIETYKQAPLNWSVYFDSGGGWPLEMKEFHRLLPKGRILEVGAGGGRDARELIKLGYTYIGIDISEPLLVIARKNCPGAEFINMSLYDLHFPEKFDGFWASAVLLHIPKKRINNVLQKLKSAQKKGAIGFISIKDGQGEEVTSKEINGLNGKRFFAYWSKNEFSEILDRNGFGILHYGYRRVTLNTNWHTFIVQTSK